MGRFFAGLDLGQTQDPSALAVLEQVENAEAGKFVYLSDLGWEESQRQAKLKALSLPIYLCRYLYRYPLGTPYLDIAQDVEKKCSKPPLQGCIFGVDRTGVGAAVMEMIRARRPQCQLRPILITSGHATTFQTDGIHVPKRELAGVLVSLFESRRLKIARELEHGAALEKELPAFKVKITTAGNETFEAWREKDHDDLILAVAIAAWLAEREKLGAGLPTLLGKPQGLINPHTH